MPGAAIETMVNARTSPSVAHVSGREVDASTGGAGVTAVEVPGAAAGALVSHEMRAVAQHEVVDQRYLAGHVFGSTKRRHERQTRAPVAIRSQNSCILRGRDGSQPGRRLCGPASKLVSGSATRLDDRHSCGAQPFPG